MPRLEFLLDADMPRSAADVLRSLKLDVEDVRDIGVRAASDADIMAHAQRTNRVIITRDTDFGEVLRYPSHPGVIILRLPWTFRAADVNSSLRAFLEQTKADEIRGAVSIVELGRVRRRPIG